MNVEIGIEALIILSCEYLFQMFGILSMQCGGLVYSISQEELYVYNWRHVSNMCFNIFFSPIETLTVFNVLHCLSSLWINCVTEEYGHHPNKIKSAIEEGKRPSFNQAFPAEPMELIKQAWDKVSHYITLHYVPLPSITFFMPHWQT
jgi:hypothetical protein